MTPEIVCRRPALTDAPQLAEVATLAWQVGFEGLLPQAFLEGLDAERSRAQWAKDLATEGVGLPHFLLAERSGHVLGFSASGPSRDQDAGPNVAEVFALHVLPSAWGQGVGGALLQCTLNGLRDHGSVAAMLWVIDGNTRARRFYEAQAWKADGTERINRHFAGVSMHELRYRTALR